MEKDLKTKNKQLKTIMIYRGNSFENGDNILCNVKGSERKNSVLPVFFFYLFLVKMGMDFVGRKIRETYKFEIARYLAIIRQSLQLPCSPHPQFSTHPCSLIALTQNNKHFSLFSFRLGFSTKEGPMYPLPSGVSFH